MKNKLVLLLIIPIILGLISCEKGPTAPTTTSATTTISPTPTTTITTTAPTSSTTTTSSSTTVPITPGSIAVFFSPRGGCTDEVIAQISRAVNSIDVAMYSFTSDPIAQALVNAKGRGVIVRVLLDRSQAQSSYSKASFLASCGIQVSLYTHSGKMHNKIAIIDGAVVITGSFNWSNVAEERNQENMLVITDSWVAQIYENRFNTLWEDNLGGIITPSALIGYSKRGVSFGLFPPRLK